MIHYQGNIPGVAVANKSLFSVPGNSSKTKAGPRPFVFLEATFSVGYFYQLFLCFFIPSEHSLYQNSILALCLLEFYMRVNHYTKWGDTSTYKPSDMTKKHEEKRWNDFYTNEIHYSTCFQHVRNRMKLHESILFHP